MSTASCPTEVNCRMPVPSGSRPNRRIGGAEHLGGHHAERVLGLLAVGAGAEVDLRQRVDAVRVDGVEEDGDLDAVPGGERQRLEQRATTGVLAGERLHQSGQLGAVQPEQRTGDQLGDPTAVLLDAAVVADDRPLVEPLHQLHLGAGQQRAEQADA